MVPADSFVASFLLALGAIASILGVGIAVVCAVARHRSLIGLELLAYGGALGVVVHATIGLATVCLPWSYQLSATIALISCNAVAWVYWWRKRIFAELGAEGWFAPRVVLSAWLLLVAICVAVSHAPIRFPDTLFDGPYVIKNHNLHVKIQTITGHLPADNYVPYLAGEFLLRDIQFSEERPLMPGQEVSNRPILMALAALPFRAALDPPPKQTERLPKFQYAGSDWPDVGTLGEDRYFRQFLVVGIVLNGMFILSTGLLFFTFGLSRWYAVAGLVLLVLSPYFISQVLFTWPKALAAFFLLLAVHALKFRNWAAVAGLLSALAYLSHPFAIVFAGSFGLYLAFRDSRRSLFFKDTLSYAAMFLAGVVPWFIWSMAILDIPSDLVTQNLLTNSNYADLIWVRLHNAYIALFPGFFGAYPYNADQFLQSSLVSLPGVIGLFFVFQAYAGCIRYFEKFRFLVTNCILVPGVLLIGIFSAPAVPLLHGFQAVAPLLLLLSLKWMQDRLSSRWLALLFVLQVALNLAMLNARATTLGL